MGRTIELLSDPSLFQGTVFQLLLEVLVKSIVLLLVVYLVDRIFLRNRPLAADTIWRMTILMLVVLPVTCMGLPKLALLQVPFLSEDSSRLSSNSVRHHSIETSIPTPPTAGDISKSQSLQNPKSSQNENHTGKDLSQNHTTSSTQYDILYSPLFVIIYALAMIYLLLKLTRSIIALKQLPHHSQKLSGTLWNNRLKQHKQTLKIRSSIQLYSSDKIRSPVTYGLFRPVVHIPCSLLDTNSSRTVDAILLHELTHIARSDFLLHILLRILQCFLWCNPLIWLAGKRIEELREMICDGYCATNMDDSQNYIDVLLDQAQELAACPSTQISLSMAGFIKLESRLKFLKKFSITRFSLSEKGLAFSICLAALTSALLGSTGIAATITPTDSPVRPPSAQPTLNHSSTIEILNLAQTFVPNETQLGGKVIDSEGNALKDVFVDACTWCRGNETSTNQHGQFLLGGFQPHSSTQIQFSKRGYAPRLFDAQLTGSTDWVVVMKADTWLEGTVFSPEGAPVPNAEIRAVRKSYSPVFKEYVDVETKITADQKGKYRLLLEPAKYEIIVRTVNSGSFRQANVIVSAEQQKQFDITLTTGLTFKAKLINSLNQKPVTGIKLKSWRPKGITGISDKNGMIEIQNLSSGKVQFGVYGQEELKKGIAGDFARWWSPQATSEYQRFHKTEKEFQRNFDRLEFDLTEKNNAVTIYLEPCTIIRGQVLDPQNQPVGGATVTAARTNTGNSLTGDTRYSYQTDSEGHFEARFPAGESFQYNLIAHDGKYKQWRQWANGVSPKLQTNPGEVIHDLKLQLTSAGTLKGHVINQTGKSVPNIDVVAIPQDMKHNRYYLKFSQSDKNGNFTLDFLRPGKYWILADNISFNPLQRPDSIIDEIEIKPNQTVTDYTIRLAR